MNPTLLLMLAGTAQAQDNGPDLVTPDLNANLYRPSVDSRYTLWTDETGWTDRNGGTFKAQFDYFNDPLVVTWAEGGREEIISNALALDLVGAWQISRFRLGVDAPIYVLSNSADGYGSGGAGFGDVSIDGRVGVLDNRTAPVGLAFGARLTLPTATVDLPLGAPGWGWEVEAIVDKPVGNALLAFNVGHRANPLEELDNVTWSNQLFYRGGLGYVVNDATGFSVDVAGAFTYEDRLSNTEANPIEGLLGGWRRIGESFVLRGGVGTGLTNGIGSPKVRVLAGIGWEPQWAEAPVQVDVDTDGDGWLDADDACPTEPEDLDGYDDTDGCPDPTAAVTFRVEDPEGNGLDTASLSLTGEGADTELGAGRSADLNPGSYVVSGTLADHSPAEASFMVAQGVDGEIVLVLSPVVHTSSVRVRIVDVDGNLLPGGTWSVDGAPGVPTEGQEVSGEYPVGDHDLIASAPNHAPREVPFTLAVDAETELEIVLKTTKVKVTAEQIELKEAVFFETSSAVIKTESHELLDEVAVIMKQHPEIKKVRIEGHTDSRGGAQLNQELSEARAASVLAYLVDRGVESARLESAGFGETRPLDDRPIENAWKKNRRVDLFIVEQDTQVVPAE